MEKTLNQEKIDAVITVPAYIQDLEKRIKPAGKLVGFNVLRKLKINE